MPTSGCMSLAHMVASLHYVPSANILVNYLFKEENNALKRHVTRFFPNIWYSYCKFKLLISWFLLGFTIFLTKQKKLLFQWSLLFLRSFYMFFFIIQSFFHFLYGSIFIHSIFHFSQFIFSKYRAQTTCYTFSLKRLSFFKLPRLKTG